MSCVVHIVAFFCGILGFFRDGFGEVAVFEVPCLEWKMKVHLTKKVAEGDPKNGKLKIRFLGTSRHLDWLAFSFPDKGNNICA
jgi:hypothetical protein